MATGPSSVDEHGSDTKLAEAILYVSKRMELEGDPYRGSVKLNKILWWADFESYRRNGYAVTAAQYQRLPEGPAPVRLVPVRNRLEADGHAHIESFDRGDQHSEAVVVADREPDREVLKASDLEALDEAIDYFFGKSGSQASEISHRQSAGWQAVKNGQLIPYETAIIDTAAREFPADTEDRVRGLLQAHGASVSKISH